MVRFNPRVWLARVLWRWSDRLNRWAIRLFVAGGR